MRLQAGLRALDFSPPDRRNQALPASHRGRARAWARTFYDASPALQGLYFPSSMNGNEPAIALTDRAERSRCVPDYPDFNRALADDALVDILKHSARLLGYGLV